MGDFGKMITNEKILNSGGAMKGFKDIKEVKRLDEQSNIIYFKNLIPMVSTRDFCVYNTYKEMELEGKTVMLFVTKSVEVEGVQDKDCVRVNMFRTGLFEKMQESGGAMKGFKDFKEVQR